MAFNLFTEGVLHDVDVAAVERRLAVRQVKLPGAQEDRIKALGQHLGAPLGELAVPAAQGFGVVGAKGEFLDHAQAGPAAWRRESVLGWAGSRQGRRTAG